MLCWPLSIGCRVGRLSAREQDVVELDSVASGHALLW